MNEQLEEQNAEEPRIEPPPEAVPESAAEGAPEEPAPVWNGPAWLRLAYAGEFLLALAVIFIVWSEVGGQGHLDLMPWYIKLGCVLSLAWCCVRFTAAVVEHPKAWNQHTAVWFTGIILVAAAMAGITYYYHLHEAPDETDTDDATSTSLHAPLFPIQPRDRSGV